MTGVRRNSKNSTVEQLYIRIFCIFEGQIYQNCANDEYAKTVRPCKVDLDIWEEVCKCDKKNCNTYSYYRRAIDVDTTKDDGQPMNFDNPFLGPEGNSNGFSNSQLIILLICVPLGVGVVAVVFVFINYHCK